MPQNYTLMVVNESDETVTVCIYQTEPESSLENAVSLAWFVKVISAGGSLLHRWTED